VKGDCAVRCFRRLYAAFADCITDSPAGKHDRILADHRMGGQAMESVIAKGSSFRA
jgi:hypothetical protein